MSFQKAVIPKSVYFNSAYSSKLLEIYRDQAIQDIQGECARAKSRTFAPSAMRCQRKQWFRLRGVETDQIETPDLGLNFRADVGTARHISIQTRLKEALGEDWIEVYDYLKENPSQYDIEVVSKGIESLVTVKSPPVKFAVDGIIRIDGKVFLLEIKTTEYAAFEQMEKQKSVHEDQVILYSLILGIREVLFLYEDRQNGGMKSFQYHVSEQDISVSKSKIRYIMDLAEQNIAPDRLPPSDYMCSNCEYAKKCNQW